MIGRKIVSLDFSLISTLFVKPWTSQLVTPRLVIVILKCLLDLTDLKSVELKGTVDHCTL